MRMALSLDTRGTVKVETLRSLTVAAPWEGGLIAVRQGKLKHAPQLAADQQVRTALNHEAGASAVAVAIPEAVGGQIVDQDGLATGNRHPCVGVATLGVAARVADAQRRTVIHAHVGRAGLGRTHAAVRAARTFLVVVLGHQGIIAEPGLRLHCMLRNIAQAAVERRMFWR